MPVSTGAAILGAAGIGAATSLLGGSSQSKGISSAANASNAQAAADRELQRYIYETNRAMNEPWRAGGTDAVMNLRHYLMASGLDSSLLDAYEAKPFDFQADPGYQFRLNEGQRGLERSAAARGGYLSGNALKGLNQYNQNFASNEYNNAFNRWSANTTNEFNRHNTTQSNQFNKLASLAGLGQSAVGQVGNAGAQYANASSNSGWNNANNQANAAMAQGNVNSSMYGGIGNALAYGLNRGVGSGLFGGGSDGGGGNPFSWQPDDGSYTFGTGYTYRY